MNLFNNNFLSDVNIKYNNNIYFCHKQILSKSLFFRRIFQNENNFNSIKNGILEIRDEDGYKFKDFETTIKYIYGINNFEEIDFLLICKDLQFLEVPIYEKELYNVVRILVFDNETTRYGKLEIYPFGYDYCYSSGWSHNILFNLLYDEFFDAVIIKLYQTSKCYYPKNIKKMSKLFYPGRISRMIDKRLIRNSMFSFEDINLDDEILDILDEKTLEKYNKWKSIKFSCFKEKEELEEQDKFFEIYKSDEYEDVEKLKYDREVMSWD